jgi:hypothetical protein
MVFIILYVNSTCLKHTLIQVSLNDDFHCNATSNEHKRNMKWSLSQYMKSMDGWMNFWVSECMVYFSFCCVQLSHWVHANYTLKLVVRFELVPLLRSWVLIHFYLLLEPNRNLCRVMPSGLDHSKISAPSSHG